MEYIYKRSYLYPKQEAIIDFNKKDPNIRWSFSESATKVGKSYACLIWLMEQCMFGEPEYQYIWISPGYKQATDMFTRACRGMKKNGLLPEHYTINKSNFSITLANGSCMTFRSGENSDAFMGSDIKAVVMDEASLIPEETWDNIQSTITATKGVGIAIGNLNGRNNWHFKICRQIERGKLPKFIYNKLTAYDAIEGGLYTEEDLEDAKKSMSKGRFEELYLCIPSESGINPFGIESIQKCIIEEDDIEDTNIVCYGVDLASKVDYTAVIGLNKKRQVVVLKHFKGDWITIEKKLTNIIANVPALVDETGCGTPVLEHLQEEMPNVEGFTFTNKSKGGIIEELAIKIQNKEVTFPQSWLVDELENFELERTKTGKLKYDARTGHDDGVCALALALHHHSEVSNTTELVWSF